MMSSTAFSLRMVTDRASLILFLIVWWCQATSAFLIRPLADQRAILIGSRRVDDSTQNLHRYLNLHDALKGVPRRDTQLSLLDNEDDGYGTGVTDPDFEDDFEESIIDGDKLMGRGPLFGDLFDFTPQEGEEPRSFTGQLGILFAIFLLLATGIIFPGLQIMTESSAPPAKLSDAAVSQQTPQQRIVPARNDKFKLSRAQIQEKLGGIPVFYIARSDGSMQEEIYVSYNEANSAASSSGGTVKVTTLDQVTYPLILKRGRMRMEPPPDEVRRAEERLFENSDALSFKFVPSKQALQDAKALGTVVPDGDVPLFLAEKLAFQTAKGASLPLFLDQKDAVTSYNRLRKVNKDLPEQPVIRSLTLLDELKLMEGGLPGLDKVVIYSTEADLNQAVKIYEKQEGIPKYADDEI